MLSDVGCHVRLKENDYTSIEILDLRTKYLVTEIAASKLILIGMML